MVHSPILSTPVRQTLDVGYIYCTCFQFNSPKSHLTYEKWTGAHWASLKVSSDWCMMVGIGKCYPLYCNCQIQMSQTPQLPLSTGQKSTFFKTRLENQALALRSPWALLSNWRVLLKMLHLHWKINATLHPSVHRWLKLHKQSHFVKFWHDSVEL